MTTRTRKRGLINDIGSGFRSGSASNLTSSARYTDSMSSSRPYSSLSKPAYSSTYETQRSNVSFINGSTISTSCINRYNGSLYPLSSSMYQTSSYTSKSVQKSISHSSTSLSQSNPIFTGSAYDSGIRSYNSARALNDSSSYGNRYGSSYEPTNRYGSTTAAASNRYGSSMSAVDRYSTPARTGSSSAWGASSYSNLGRYGSGEINTPTPYRSTNRDYKSTSPSRSYSYSSGLPGSSNARSSYTTSGGYSKPTEYSSYTNRYISKRPDDYSGSSGRLYTSLSDAHSNIVGRRQSLARGDSITVSSTPQTPTEPIQKPIWREKSADAAGDADTKSWTDSLKVDATPTIGFTLAKPSLPSPIAEKSPPPPAEDVQKDHLMPTTNDDFDKFYNRYVTHSPILDVERRSPVAQADNQNQDQQADDSAYSSRMEESMTTKEDSQSRTSDNIQDEIEEEADEIEYEAEEVGTEVEEQHTQIEKTAENSETEKEDKNDISEDEKNYTKSSGKACLDIEPPWQQFVSSFDEEEDETEGQNIKQQSAEPNQSMVNSMYENEEEEEEEAPAPTRKKRIMMSFADAIKQRCEEVTGVALEEDEPKSNQGSYYDPMTSSNCWQQFSFYEDDPEADEAEGEEEASTQVPPWQQFIDYAAKPINKYHIQVQAMNESESEYTSDEEERSHRSQDNKNKPNLQIGKPQAFMRLLAPPKDSGAETSSEIESDYEAANNQPKTFPFLPNEEKTEERGRVESHLAQPPPVFSIKVTYDEEESVGTVSEYEDSEEEYEKERSVSPVRRTQVPQIMITSTDMDSKDEKNLKGAGSERENSSVEPEGSHDDESDNSVTGTIKIPKKQKTPEKAQTNAELTIKPIITDDKQDTSHKDDKINISKVEDKKADSQPKAIPEIVLHTVTAKQVTENVPSDHVERFFPKKEQEDRAMLRTVKGVQEYARTNTLPTFATAAQPIQKVPSQKTEPAPKLSAQFGNQEKHNVPNEYVERISNRKPEEAWARKSLVPESKFDKAAQSSLLTKINVEPMKNTGTKPIELKSKATDIAKRKFELPQVEAPKGPSFEEQMEELRKKMRAGTSQLSQQMKDMSKGIVDATTNAKLAAEIATTKGLIDDAANLRQAVSKKYDQWKTSAQEEMEKRERELQQPVNVKNPMLEMLKATSPALENVKKVNEEKKSAKAENTQKIELDKKDAKKPAEDTVDEKKQQPYTRKNTGMREPGKIASPYAEKVKKESELAKAAVEEQARREANRLQKQKEEQQKQKEELQKQNDMQMQKPADAQQQMQKQKEQELQLQKQKQAQKIIEEKLRKEAEQKQLQQKMLQEQFNKEQAQHQKMQQVLQQKDNDKQNLKNMQMQDKNKQFNTNAEQVDKNKAPLSKIGQKEQVQSEKKTVPLVSPMQGKDKQQSLKDSAKIPDVQKIADKATEKPTGVSGGQGSKPQNDISAKNKSIEPVLTSDQIKNQEKSKINDQNKTQDKSKITKSSQKQRKWRRRRPNRFIGELQDIDELLNSKNRLSTFDQFELFYQNCSKDVKKPASTMKQTKTKPSKIYIWDTTDIDELYDKNDLRLVMGMFSPTSKVIMNFDDAVAKHKSGDHGPKKPSAAGSNGKKIDESTFQIYRSYESGQGDYGTYLDSDLSLAEQPDELAVLKEGKRTSLVLRTQLSVRVHTIIEKLLNSNGRELRRALFSLKQIFQDDKDLVHEFVQNDGLACLIKVGTEADQNYQNYILRAIGQVMLYVDGMNGCIAHNDTIQWLYSLLSSPFRLVVKTALKLLLVFVEYTESNSLLLLAAVYIVDKNRGAIPWSNLTQLLTNKDNAGGDLELLIYAMTLLNTTLNGIPDQDTYYDIVDALEEQGMEDAIKRLLSLGNQELSDQCRMYEAVLREEDGTPDENGMTGSVNSPAMNIARMRQTPRTRTGSSDRKSQRKRNGAGPDDNHTPNSRYQQNGTNSNRGHPETASQQPRSTAKVRAPPLLQKVPGFPQTSTQQPQPPTNEIPGLPANKRLTMDLLYKRTNSQQDDVVEPEAKMEAKKKTSLSSYLQNQEHAETPERDMNATLQKTRCPPPALPDLSNLTDIPAATTSTSNESPMSPPGTGQKGGRSNIGAVHSLAEKYQKPNDFQMDVPIQQSPSQVEDEDASGGSGAFASALAKARKGMDKKVAAREPVDNRKESEIQWEQAMQNWKERPLIINDLDFTELDDSDDQDPVRMATVSGGHSSANTGVLVNPYTGVVSYGASVPPPPPSFGNVPPPPPPGGTLGVPPAPRLTSSPGPSSRAPSPNQQQLLQQQQNPKTVKLFWKEAQVQPLPGLLDKKGVFWEKVKPVDIDIEKLSQLFETKTKEVVAKKKEDTKQELRILDTKRSNAINIGLKKLPPPGAIRTAITKFDSAILNKEGIEKILTTMMPTEEEKERIADALAMNPDAHLGEAERFLLMLGEIPQLHARLRLWMFMLDYSNIEKEVADPLMDLKLAMEELDESKTFQYVMATLLAVGNYLNGAEIKGFQIDYLAKVPEVKDTVHKHSLTYHLCTIVMDKFPDSTDLYSELGAVVRCARVDFDEIDQNLQRLEKDCKASWDYLRLLAKHESQALKQKMSEFLTECAQRIVTLKTIHRRVINRFRKFLLYMGMPQHSIKDTKVNSICKTIAEFALEYRTCRDKMQQQKKRMMEKRERNKTRGKMITETRQLQQNGDTTTPRDDDGGRRQHDELSRLLKSGGARGDDETSAWMGSYPGARLRSTRHQATPSATSTMDRSLTGTSGGQESPDDEILDGLVKAATVKTDHSRVEQRRKARQFNRKSLRRTRTLKLVEDQVGGGDSGSESTRNY